MCLQVGQILLELWSSGRERAASNLLAAVADRSLAVARNAVILMVRQASNYYSQGHLKASSFRV